MTGLISEGDRVAAPWIEPDGEIRCRMATAEIVTGRTVCLRYDHGLTGQIDKRYLERYQPNGEAARMAERLANLSPRTILANARRLARPGYCRKPNWVLAMEVFGLGSTYARALCLCNGVDPDSNGIAAL